MANEVFILANDDRTLAPRTFPNRGVVGCVQTEVEDVRSRMTSAGNPVCQRRRELRVNQEVHAGCKTA